MVISYLKISMENVESNVIADLTKEETNKVLSASRESKQFNFSKTLKFLTVIVLVGFIMALILGIGVGIPLFRAYQDGRAFYRSVLAVKEAVKSQDISRTKEAVLEAQGQLERLNSQMSTLAWLRVLPLVGSYANDAFVFLGASKEGLETILIVVEAVEPYADLLGLKGRDTFTGGTTEDRIVKVVETLDKIIPQVDQISAKIATINKLMNEVDAEKYPTNFQGRNLKEQISSTKEMINLVDSFMSQAGPTVKRLPTLLGVNKEAKYLVLFQNDAELRPTGGFITAYAIFRVEKGRVFLNASDDIYKLDAQMKRHVASPAPIARYLNVYEWRMRDANFSPDFYWSMKTFEDLYAMTGSKEEFTGIIAMDTNVLVSVINVLGPISVYGTKFTTEKVPQCNCPMIVWELEKYADEPTHYERESRKDIIGVMLQAILKKVLTGSRDIYGPLFQVVLKEASEKHILVYLRDNDAQKGIEALNFGGRIKTYNGDYLHINDANLGGAKSNLFVAPKVTQEVTITDTGADEVLTIEYRYPQKADNCSLERKGGLCLAGIYRNYQRIYLPKGAVVLETKGYESKNNIFEDLGYTVVDGFFTVVPEGLARVMVKYRIPGNFKNDGVYTSLIQKQPGTRGIPYKIVVNGKVYEFNLIQDKELRVKL